jgi:hypothetical protein
MKEPPLLSSPLLSNDEFFFAKIIPVLYVG